jgi:hypothetical protein
MTIIDPTTPIGKLRLRCGDFGDFPILPDSVYTSALADCNQSLPRASRLCAQYILGTLTAKTHRKLSSLETWSGEYFDHYVQFIKLTILNPNLMSFSPVPYTHANEIENPLPKFIREWNLNYSGITQAEQMTMDAIGVTQGQL